MKIDVLKSTRIMIIITIIIIIIIMIIIVTIIVIIVIVIKIIIVTMTKKIIIIIIITTKIIIKIEKIYCRQTYGHKVALTKDEAQENKCLRKESKKKRCQKKSTRRGKISDVPDVHMFCFDRRWLLKLIIDNNYVVIAMLNTLCHW